MAQEENEVLLPNLNINGSVDSYFRYSINSTNDQNERSEGATIAPPTSFANGSGFTLGMANLVLSHRGEKGGFLVDLVVGPRGQEAVFGSTSNSNIVNQLYAYIDLSETATMTVGNFNTFVGYEVISPSNNFNYSTSYMFSNGPFSHTGIKVDLGLGDDSGLMLGIFNPTDATETNPDNTYYGGFQISHKGVYLNTLFNDRFLQVDLTGGWDLSHKLYLGVNSSIAVDSFSGAALYLQRSITDAVEIGVRGEYFQDNGLDLLGEGEEVIDLTLSANCQFGNLVVIPELRVDRFSKDDYVVTSTKNQLGPETSNSLSSFLLAVVYAF